MGSLREQREKKILCFRLCYNVPHTNGFGLHCFCLLRHTHTEEIRRNVQTNSGQKIKIYGSRLVEVYFPPLGAWIQVQPKRKETVWGCLVVVRWGIGGRLFKSRPFLNTVTLLRWMGQVVLLQLHLNSKYKFWFYDWLIICSKLNYLRNTRIQSISSDAVNSEAGW